MTVATFGPASLPAQLAELERIRADRDARTDAMDLSSKRATSHEIAHRNNALDGAIATLNRLAEAQQRGEPGRQELVDCIRACRTELWDALHSGMNEEAFKAEPIVEQIDGILARIPT